MSEEKERETFKLFNKDDEARLAKEVESPAARGAKLPKGYVGETALLCFESVLELAINMSRNYDVQPVLMLISTLIATLSYSQLHNQERLSTPCSHFGCVMTTSRLLACKA